MFKDIYSTTPCSPYNMAPIVFGLKSALISGEMVPMNRVIQVLTARDKSTPPFAHPIIIHTSQQQDQWVVVDGRACTRWDNATGKLVVSSATEYDFMMTRAKLQDTWVDGGARDMVTLGTIAPYVFTRWISEGLARRLNLDPLEQLQVAVVAGLYYLQLFQDEFVSEEDLPRMAVQVGRVVNLPVDKVLAIADQIQPMASITDFVSAVKTVVSSVRVEALSPALLYGILGGCWFGANAREIVAVALEHPPTYLAILYTALTNRTYHRSFMAQLASACDRHGTGKQFVINVQRLLEAPRYA